MRIVIVSSGRSHLLDLARELHGLGHEVGFYSYVSRGRAEKFGLPSECHRGLLPHVLPMVAIHRIGPFSLTNRIERYLQLTIDQVVARMLGTCDVFIGLSGLCLTSAITARQKYGATIFIERGSRHILSQKEILETMPGAKGSPISELTIQRELWAYEFADVITVPSRHVECSFVERGIPIARLFRNPYGVDLKMFQPTEAHVGPPTVIFVGEWSLRKGCDILWEACRTANSWRLLHVGAIGDAPVPRHSLFIHHDVVPQSELPKFYEQAHVFAHASREEGLSLVQAQALACGLPLVCTDRTGGEDLREILGIPEWVIVVPAGNAVALAEGIIAAFARAKSQHGLRDILGAARDRLSWSAYGKRYHDELLKRCSQ